MLSPTTNIAALVAKRNLNENSLQATRSISKVSQGTRIVKPMDDAASLAIANTMRTSLAGMTQGIRNTTQGSSLLQVAAGGLEQTSQMLTRMKQLAVQVINDTLGAAEISYANEEFGQLMQQIDATAEQTRFSGKSLLTGGSADTNYRNASRTASFSDTNTPITVGGNTTAHPYVNAFEGTINEATSSGFINATFPGDISDIKLSALDGVITLNIDGELFSGSTAVVADGELVLTSESEPNNVLAINLGSDVTSINTDDDLVLGLKTLLLDAQINIGENKGIHKHAAHGTEPNTFEANDILDPSRTRGVVTGEIRDADGIEVTGNDGGPYTVIVVINNETFRKTAETPAAGEVLELVSTTNPGSQIGLRYDESNVTGFDTALNFKLALAEVFLPRDIPSGVPAGNAATFDAIDFTNIDIRNRFKGSFGGQVGNISAETRTINNVDYTDVRLTIGSETFRTLLANDLADDDLVTFVSTSNAQNEFTLQTGTTGIALGDIQAQLTTYFQDGGGVLTELDVNLQTADRPQTFNVGDSESVFNDYSDTIVNGFAGFNTQYSKGFIEGLATDIAVEGSDEGPFDISLVVGDQTFIQRGFNPEFAGNLTLVSQSDPDNVISYTVGAFEDTLELLNSKAKLQVALESLFGLSELDPSAPVRFRSASASNHDFNGISMGNNQTIIAGTATPPGKYAVSYDAETRTMKLTSGHVVYEEELEARNVINGETTVSFGNGVTLQLGNDVNKFDINSDLTQMIFEVDQNDVVQLEFQISDISRDDAYIKMTAATVDALRLTGATINGKDLARDAQDKIDLAITSINTGLATIGAQQSRFEFVRVNLTIQMENTNAARATYYDVDMAGEITDFTKFQTLTQAATSMLSQANQLPQELLRLLP